MFITALAENKSNTELKAIHGLSLYIETRNHKMLFDVGPDGTLFDNAEKRNIDLTAVDTVIISHGHADHGGALKQFLNINSSARILIQRKAFETHCSVYPAGKRNISLDRALISSRQITLLDGDTRIDEELSLFTVKNLDCCYSAANDTLLADGIKDDFSHEQNLIIQEEKTALIMGCGHTGIVNIMKKAEQYHPSLCVGGYHLQSRSAGNSASSELLDKIAEELSQYPQTEFYTCHCTGMEAYEYLSRRLPNMHYLSCGETISL
ncbi:MAG: MBL fold metallo-hydrolase [Erysipelotrichia bacterium]|nr:MBL fold metallo-hydrolase [Erysipelotrichia bacterium]